MIRSFILFTIALLVTGMMTYVVMGSRQEKRLMTWEVRSEAPGQFISLEHGQVHYLLEGPDTAELIVFIHGGGVTGMEVWQKNIPYFINKGYRVLAYDLYGRGFSDRPAVQHSPELFKNQFNQLLSGLHLSTPLHLVAMSMGAIIALDYASEHPDRIKKLVIIDPAATGDYKPQRLLTIPVVSDVLMTMYWYPHAIENQRKEFADKALFDRYAKRLEYFMGFKGYKKSNYSTWMNMLNQNKLHLVNAIPSSNVLLIYGGQDPYFNEAKDKLYRSGIPSLQVVKIDLAGHMPQFEKPDEVNLAIYSFLEGRGEVPLSLYQ